MLKTQALLLPTPSDPPHGQIFKVLSLKTQSFNNSFSYSHLSNERPGNGSTAPQSPLALASSSSSPLWILTWLLLAQQKSLITFPASWGSFLEDTVNGIRQKIKQLYDLTETFISLLSSFELI